MSKHSKQQKGANGLKIEPTKLPEVTLPDNWEEKIARDVEEGLKSLEAWEPGPIELEPIEFNWEEIEFNLDLPPMDWDQLEIDWEPLDKELNKTLSGL